MKILFASSEAAPFVKTGGLGEVVGSLFKALKKNGLDVRIILPKYDSIPVEYKKNTILKKKLTVPVGWRQQYCGVEKVKYKPIYLLDNEYYFKRDNLYGYYDEAERYAFFCRAVLEALPYLEFTPDIIHCHDWHTGVISVFLKSHYQDNEYYNNMRTVFTIHNLKYQGIFPREVLYDLLSLGDGYFNIDALEFFGNVNFMKGGIVFSDVITTVSPSYAEEIQTPYFGEGLDGILRVHKKKLHGILNGIDYKEYNPASDKHIWVKYNSNSIQKKAQNKLKLQQELNLLQSEDTPLIAVVSRLVEQKGIDLIQCVFNEIMDMDVQMVILGTGEARYEEFFRWMAQRYPEKLSINILFDNALAHKIYAAADLLLMPSRFEPCGISQMVALRYGCLPIVRETGGLKDTIIPYNEYTGEGNGFSFRNYNAHDMLYTIRRAVGFFSKKEVWFKIVKNAMATDCSWDKPALEYMKLYEKLLEQ